MKIKIISKIDEFIALQYDWSKMIKDTLFDRPFYSWDWYTTWWKHFGNDNELYVIAVEDTKGRLTAVAPFMKSKRNRLALKISELRFIDNAIGPRNTLLFRIDDSGTQAIEEIIRFLSRNSKDWDLLNLVNIDENIPFLKDFNAYVKKYKMNIIKTAGRRSPYLILENNFQKYLAHNFNSRQRNDINRSIKKVSKRGKYTVKQFSEFYEMNTALDLAFKVSKSSWKGAISRDMSSSDSNRAFYNDITNHFCRLNQIRIWILFLEEEPIAFQYQLICKENVYLLINDFDRRYAELSPGTALMYHVIERYHKESIRKFDLCGEDYPYKIKWASDIRNHVNIQMFSRKFYSNSIFLGKTKLLPIFKKIKSALVPSKNKTK